MTNNILLCQRVDALAKPHVPSEIEPCSRCGQPVWVDIKMPLEPARVCILCVAKQLTEDQP